MCGGGRDNKADSHIHQYMLKQFYRLSVSPAYSNTTKFLAVKSEMFPHSPQWHHCQTLHHCPGPRT